MADRPDRRHRQLPPGDSPEYQPEQAPQLGEEEWETVQVRQLGQQEWETVQLRPLRAAAAATAPQPSSSLRPDQSLARFTGRRGGHQPGAPTRVTPVPLPAHLRRAVASMALPRAIGRRLLLPRLRLRPDI